MSKYKDEFWIQIEINLPEPDEAGKRIKTIDYTLNIPVHVEDEQGYVHADFNKKYTTLIGLLPKCAIYLTAYKEMGIDKYSKTWSSWYSFYGPENNFLKHT